MSEISEFTKLLQEARLLLQMEKVVDEIKEISDDGIKQSLLQVVYEKTPESEAVCLVPYIKRYYELLEQEIELYTQITKYITGNCDIVEQNFKAILQLSQNSKYKDMISELTKDARQEVSYEISLEEAYNLINRRKKVQTMAIHYYKRMVSELARHRENK